MILAHYNSKIIFEIIWKFKFFKKLLCIRNMFYKTTNIIKSITASVKIENLIQQTKK